MLRRPAPTSPHGRCGISDVSEAIVPTQIVSDTAEFLALEREWNALADRFATPLMRHEWFAACLDAFGEGLKLAVVVARQDGRAQAIAPLAVDRSGGLPRLIVLSHHTHEPTGFLYADEASLASVCGAVRGFGLAMVLPRLGMDCGEIEWLRAAPRTRGLLIERATPTTSAFVPLPAGWVGLEAAMSGEDRSKLRRLRKLAEREGPVSIEIVAPDDSTLERVLDEVFAVEAAGWKSRAGTAMLADRRIRRFVTRYAHAAAQRETLRIFLMRIGEAIAAAQIAVEQAGRLWYIKQGYDERFAKCAPGITLTHETLRYACERNLAACEFLGLAETWQQRWPIEIRQYTSARFYPPSVASGLALGADVWHFAVRERLGALRSRFARTRNRNPAGEPKLSSAQ
jgi:CelD/BcsL family acetyltransferase involved in cellulose biosynthesis